MQLFKEENFRVRISDEARLLKEFKNVLAADKDRQKRNATKELAYVYFMNDWRSPFIKYDEKERHNKVMREVDLPDTWKKTKRIKAAEDLYNELQETPTVLSLKSIHATLLTARKVVNALRKQIEESLEHVDDEPEYDDEGNPIDTDTSSMDDTLKNLMKLIELGQKIPATIKIINDLTEQVKKEQANESRIKGGGQKGAFEE